MNKMLLVLSVSLLTAAFVAPPTAGLHCNGVITQIDIAGQTLYIDDRSSTRPGEYNYWFYIESNDIKGLQSGGDNYVLPEGPGFKDSCVHWPWDQLIV